MTSKTVPPLVATGKSTSFFGCHLQLVSSVSKFFKPFFINLNFVNDESGASTIIKSAIKIKTISIHVFNNSKPNPTKVAFRSNGVSVACITIPAGVTGDIDSGNLDVKVDKNAKICYMVDMSSSGSGLLAFVGHFEVQ